MIAAPRDRALMNNTDPPLPYAYLCLMLNTIFRSSIAITILSPAESVFQPLVLTSLVLTKVANSCHHLVYYTHVPGTLLCSTCLVV